MLTKKHQATVKPVEVVAASLFMDSDNALKQILAGAAPAFEAGWEIERKRLLALYTAYDEIKTDYHQQIRDAEAAGDWDLCREIEAVHFQERYLAFFTGRKNVKHAAVEPNEYTRFKESMRVNEQIQRKGFEVAVAGTKEVCMGLWAGNLRRVLEKLLIHTFAKARLVNATPKPDGYEITAYVNSRRLSVKCLDSGGSGTQPFTYRYVTNFPE